MQSVYTLLFLTLISITIVQGDWNDGIGQVKDNQFSVEVYISQVLYVWSHVNFRVSTKDGQQENAFNTNDCTKYKQYNKIGTVDNNDVLLGLGECTSCPDVLQPQSCTQPAPSCCLVQLAAEGLYIIYKNQRLPVFYIQHGNTTVFVNKQCQANGGIPDDYGWQNAGDAKGDQTQAPYACSSVPGTKPQQSVHDFRCILDI